MKVYQCPLPAPEVDYRNFNIDKMRADEDAHQEQVKAKLIELGYKGKRTGEIFSTPMGDGYARYMFADGGTKCALIHLPYGDAWDDPDVQYLPKKEVLARIDRSKGIAALFAKK
jgi:hypothetical protein